jgi:hypothetical protein
VSLDKKTAHCREGYENAEGLQTHLKNVCGILDAALKDALEI